MSIANFQPELWSAALVANFKQRLHALDIVATDWQSELAQGASAINIIVPAAGTVGTYSHASGITWAAVSSSTFKLELDQQRYVAFMVSETDLAKTNIQVIDAYVRENAYALAADAETYIYSLANGYTGGAADVAIDLTGSASIYESMLQAAFNLDSAGAPQDGRFVVVSPTVLKAMRSDENFVTATALGDAVRVTGVVGTMAGFDVLLTKNHYVTGNGTSTDKVEHLFYGVRGSIAFAMRLNGAPKIIEPDDYFGTAVKALTLYGAEPVRKSALGLVKATIDKAD